MFISVQFQDVLGFISAVDLNVCHGGHKRTETSFHEFLGIRSLSNPNKCNNRRLLFRNDQKYVMERERLIDILSFSDLHGDDWSDTNRSPEKVNSHDVPLKTRQ